MRADGTKHTRTYQLCRYFKCKTRARNRGLYIADRKLNLADARATRQNENGNRRGLECPEERDYYPCVPCEYSQWPSPTRATAPRSASHWAVAVPCAWPLAQRDKGTPL